MNKIYPIISATLLSTVAVSFALAVPIATASNHKVKITVVCPTISTKSEDSVQHYGTYLAGKGSERVNSDAPSNPLFQGPILAGTNIPTDLHAHGYKNNGVTYNPADGGIVCKYKSSMSGNDSFAISYVMENTLNGTVAGSGFEEIHIKIPVGLQ